MNVDGDRARHARRICCTYCNDRAAEWAMRPAWASALALSHALHQLATQPTRCFGVLRSPCGASVNLFRRSITPPRCASAAAAFGVRLNRRGACAQTMRGAADDMGAADASSADRKLAHEAGLETTIPWISGSCGGRTRTRTLDPLIKSCPVFQCIQWPVCRTGHIRQTAYRRHRRVLPTGSVCKTRHGACIPTQRDHG
jgi:hypothetical protein